MAIEFRLPELGENIEAGDLLKVLVSVGDTIRQDQPVLELETDKATVEVPSAVEGRVKAIHVKAGEKVKVGQLILTVEEDGTEGKAAAQRPSQAAAMPAPSSTAAQPAVAAQVVEPVPPPATPREGHALERPTEAPTMPARQAPSAPTSPEPPRPLVPASPGIRRLARELGVDIAEVTGSGPGGRITERDVKEHVRRVLSGGPGVALRTAVPLPDFSKWGAIERQPMNSIRRKTAEHLSQAWSSVPQVTQFDQADVTTLEELRSRYAKRVEEAGGKLTVTAIALKVVSSALRVFPQFAASVDAARGEIIYKKYCHIGVAVDTDRGLLVPVLRDVDRKNILELAVELASVAKKAREHKLTLAEMEGGVFTITNLGGIGGTYFSPIVNAPEVAILGLSRSRTEPVYVNGSLQPRLMLPLSLSYDHRLIDGADAARFLRWIAEALEQPFLLPLQG
jgi:pyruvate dehydrogenase E2 component (dihydrolipoamide acetyltransferase)